MSISFGNPKDKTPRIDFKSITYLPNCASISQFLNLLAILTISVASVVTVQGLAGLERTDGVD